MSQSLSNGSHTQRNQLAAMRHKHVISAVKIQWRALLLAVAGIVTVMFYWVKYLGFCFRDMNSSNSSRNVVILFYTNEPHVQSP